MRAEGFRHLREKEASVFYQETLEDYRLVGSSAGHETDGLEALQCCRRTGAKRFQDEEEILSGMEFPERPR